MDFQRGSKKVFVTFKCCNTNLKNFYKLKTITTKLERNGVVYKNTCKDCLSVYIGQTGRYLSVIRVQEHERSLRHGSQINTQNKITLFEYVISCIHTFDFKIQKL